MIIIITVGNKRPRERGIEIKCCCTLFVSTLLVRFLACFARSFFLSIVRRAHSLFLFCDDGGGGGLCCRAFFTCAVGGARVGAPTMVVTMVSGV